MPLEAAALPAPRLEVPVALRAFASAAAHERATHAWGRSYCDVMRAFRGRFDHAPDVVARPREEAEVEPALEWAAGAGVAVVPYGGGTSVVRGVTPDVGHRHAATLSLDLGALDRVLEVDEVSLAACVQAGTGGPTLESSWASAG